MNKLIPVEFKNQRVITTEILAEIYDTTTDNIKVNFNNHKENFKPGKHYFYLEGEDLKEFKSQVNDIYPPRVNKFTSSLYLWTERGANRHCKILDTDKAWEQFDNLEETYFRTKEVAADMSQLSPETQLLLKLSQSIAKQELANKQIVQAVKETKEEVQAIRDIIVLNPQAAWRRECNRILNGIGLQINNWKLPKEEVYKSLKERGNCRPNVLVNNLKKRAEANGMPPSKVEKLNILDVLENEPRLKEIYVSIVKEMAIKHGLRVKEI